MRNNKKLNTIVITQCGVYHKLLNMQLMDFVRADWLEEDVLYAVALADGSTSAKMAATGAQIIAEESIKFLKKYHSAGYEIFSTESNAPTELLSHLKNALEAEAGKYGKGVRPDELDSTILVVVLDIARNILAYFSIGDSACFIVSNGGEIKCICASPEENSITRARFIETGFHKLKNDNSIVSQVLLVSDGMFRSFYHGDRIDEDYRSLILANKTDELISKIDTEAFYDDATLVVVKLEDYI